MDTNISRIVVGVDGSAEALHALAWARDEAVLRRAALHLVHVWSPPVPVSEIGIISAPIDSTVYESLANEVLEGARASIASGSPSTLAIEAEIVQGHPSSVLLERSAGAALLVVGSRGHGGFTSLLLGSVSHQCVHHARVPVAVIPATASLPSGDDVVVGVDGSQESRQALRWAVEEALIRRARLSVLHSWSVPYAAPVASLGVAPVDPAEVAEQSERLLRDVTSAETAHLPQPIDLELLSVEEPATRALLHRAKDVGLLVVGSRGTGGFAGLLLGSVSQQCLHHTTSALVVVPHHD